jgi:predicted  nucleic acid-binding Zn ribbon protein
MTKNHTCQYCDGTLTSIRPLCGNCGHALCGEVKQITTQKVHDYLFGLPRTYPAHEYKTSCPKCNAENELNSEYTKVISYKVYL